MRDERQMMFVEFQRRPVYNLIEFEYKSLKKRIMMHWWISLHYSNLVIICNVGECDDDSPIV